MWFRWLRENLNNISHQVVDRGRKSKRDNTRFDWKQDAAR